MQDADSPSIQDPPSPAPPSSSSTAINQPAETEPKAPRSALLIVFLVVFIDLLGFGIVLPLLPLYATDLLLPLFPGDGQAPLRGMILGLLMSSFSLMQFIFAPIYGRISDRIGRRPILLLGLAGSVVFYILFGVASELGASGLRELALVLLFVARFGAGMAGATIATAQAVIADCTPPNRRAHGMALIGVAFGIGFTFGPLMGVASLLIDSHGAPGFAAAGLSLAALVIALILLPETMRTGSTAGRRRWFDWQGLRSVFRTPAVRILVITFALATFAFGGLESTLALANQAVLTRDVVVRTKMTREAIKATDRTNLLVFAYVGFVLMLTQGLIYRRLVQRVGEVRFLQIGVVAMTLGLLGAIGVLALRQQVDNPTVLYAAALPFLTVCVIGFALLTPSVQALISLRTDPSMQGEVLGVNQSGSALARILGPMICVTLFFLAPSHILPYVLGAALMGVVLLVSLRIGKK